MDHFGFTKKKFIRLTADHQHRHLAAWLAEVYQKLRTSRPSRGFLEWFTRQYSEAWAWTGQDIPVTFPPPDQHRVWLEWISDRIHQHRLAAGITVRDNDLAEPANGKDRKKAVRRFDCHLALDGIRSVFNTGSMIRTCDAAGFSSIILGNTPGGEHPGVRKTAMGAHEWMKQEKTTDLAAHLIKKRQQGYRIVALETLKNAVPYTDYPWQERIIIVAGNEEYGISSHVLKICDDFVYIPMNGRKNSVNVSNAAAVICFQAAAYLEGLLP